MLKKKINNQKIVINDLEKENNLLNQIINDNQNKIVDKKGKF